MDESDIVSKESMETPPNRVIVLDDLMNDAFNSKDKSLDSTIKLLMTKLSHHNNISVLIVCHELYPKGQNSVLFRGQLTGVHLHSVADTRKARTYVHNFLTDNDEKNQFDTLHKQHVLDIKDTSERKGRGSLVVKFSPNINENGINAGKFITFNYNDYSVVTFLTDNNNTHDE